MYPPRRIFGTLVLPSRNNTCEEGRGSESRRTASAHRRAGKAFDWEYRFRMAFVYLDRHRERPKNAPAAITLR